MTTKINGFSRKLHPYQIISYIFFFSVALTYYFITFALSTRTNKIIGGILEAISGIAVMISGYVVTSIDPSDPNLIEVRKARANNQTFTPATREFYCSTDRAYVKGKSKHCKRCNRCTYEFDHHCKWVNNDVGKANYKSFFMLISSVMVFLTVYLVFGIILTVNFINDTSLLNRDIFYFEHTKGNVLAGMVILWVFMALAGTFLVLDANLVLFHIFLTYKGLTTFQYITAVQERKEFQKELEEAKKILGVNQKTCLDFVLCLDKRRGRAGPSKSFTVQADTPGSFENNLDNFNDKKACEDLENQRDSADKRPTIDRLPNEPNTPQRSARKLESNSTPKSLTNSTPGKNGNKMLLSTEIQTKKGGEIEAVPIYSKDDDILQRKSGDLKGQQVMIRSGGEVPEGKDPAPSSSRSSKKKLSKDFNDERSKSHARNNPSRSTAYEEKGDGKIMNSLNEKRGSNLDSPRRSRDDTYGELMPSKRGGSGELVVDSYKDLGHKNL